MIPPIAAAWTKAWVEGKTQVKIASECDRTSAQVCTVISRFITAYTGRSVDFIYNAERKALAAKALANYTGEIATVIPPPNDQDFEHLYAAARREYAVMLRCEGMTYSEIGGRLGTSIERARQLTLAGSGQLSRAMRRTRVYHQLETTT